MGTKYIQRKKYVSVPVNAILFEIGNIQGPILSPVWIDIDVIYKLLINGRIVWEHCITDPMKRVRLTKKNYNDFNIYPGNSEIVDPTLDPNTYLVGVKDDINEKDYVTSNLYVQILN